MFKAEDKKERLINNKMFKAEDKKERLINNKMFKAEDKKETTINKISVSYPLKNISNKRKEIPMSKSSNTTNITNTTNTTNNSKSSNTTNNTIEIDERTRAILESYEKMKIDIDDEFSFHCTECGKCCIHREDILLTPRDLYYMSKELSLTIDEIVERYCEVYLGSDSKMILIRIMPQGTVRRCPFLKQRKCLIHNAKPMVCAMFPIGRILEHQKIASILETNQIQNSNQSQPNNNSNKSNKSNKSIQYIFVNPDCGDKSETYTVREWLKKFNIPEYDEFFLMWSEFILEFHEFFTDLEKIKGITSGCIAMIIDLICKVIYCSYDTEQEFIEQFKANKIEIEEKLFPLSRP